MPDVDREKIADFSDSWLWIVDGQYVQSPLGADELDEGENKRGLELPAVARAVRLNEAGKTAAALEEIESAADAGGEKPELHWAQAQLAFELGRFEDSLKSYQLVLDARPNDKAALFNTGLCHEKLGRSADAAGCYREAAKLDPELWAARLGLGGRLLALDEPAAALQEFDACLAKNPGQERALAGRAAALHGLGKQDEAFEIYRKLLRSKPDDSALLANLVAVAAARKDEPRLREFADKLLHLQPGDRTALEGLIAAALLRGNHDVAAHYGAQYVKTVPDSYEGWFNFGVALRKTGKIQEAANAYQQAIKIRPNGAEALGNFGIILHENDDLPRARQAYERVLELTPQDAATLWNLALLHYDSGNRDGAEKCLTKLIKLQPNREEAWMRLGYLRLERGDYAGAIQNLEKIASKPGAPSEARVNLAIAYWKSGRVEPAKTVLQGGLKDRPNAVEFLRLLAAIAIDEKNAAQATIIEGQLSELGERAPELSYNVGVLLRDAGKHEDAAQAFERALENRPDFGEALLNLGHAMKALGREGKAAEYWQAAAQLMPELAAGYFGAAK